MMALMGDRRRKTRCLSIPLCMIIIVLHCLAYIVGSSLSLFNGMISELYNVWQYQLSTRINHGFTFLQEELEARLEA